MTTVKILCIPSESANITNFQFSHYKSKETKMLYVKYGKYWPHVVRESFEYVDEHMADVRTDGRKTDDGCLNIQ